MSACSLEYVELVEVIGNRKGSPWGLPFVFSWRWTIRGRLCLSCDGCYGYYVLCLGEFELQWMVFSAPEISVYLHNCTWGIRCVLVLLNNLLTCIFFFTLFVDEP